MSPFSNLPMFKSPYVEDFSGRDSSLVLQFPEVRDGWHLRTASDLGMDSHRRWTHTLGFYAIFGSYTPLR
jgi:hypothetical protein